MRQAKILILLFCFFIAGCGTVLRYISGSKNVVRIPQIIAEISPALKDNAIVIAGNLLVQNNNESDLQIKDVTVSIFDRKESLLTQETLKWQSGTINPRAEAILPISLRLGLKSLESGLIKVKIKTEILHKGLGIKIPVDSTVAVLNLDSIKHDLMRPLELKIHTKIFPKGLRGISLNYSINIINPFNVDLALKNIELVVFSSQNDKLSKTIIRDCLLKSGENTEIKGNADLKEIIGSINAADFFHNRPLHIRLTANLCLPDTNIVTPLSIESVTEFMFFNK